MSFEVPLVQKTRLICRRSPLPPSFGRGRLMLGADQYIDRTSKVSLASGFQHEFMKQDTLQTLAKLVHTFNHG